LEKKLSGNQSLRKLEKGYIDKEKAFEDISEKI
jgi:hypothetical protein